jgi:hypothetical protein
MMEERPRKSRRPATVLNLKVVAKSRLIGCHGSASITWCV